MGQATEIAEAILRSPVTTAEAAERREEERVIREPEATPSGQIVEKPAPAAAPQPRYQADSAPWD